MFKLAWKNLLFYKGRSITTIILTFISAWMFIVYVSMMDGSLAMLSLYAGKYFVDGISPKPSRERSTGEFAYYNVYETKDGGRSWQFLNKIAETDRGRRNGNPPSLVRLSDGTLCVAYGYRGVPYSIRARTSKDNGKTWSKEIIVRDDAVKWDMGYVRMVVRPDDKVVMVYYYATKEREEQHIECTIWDPRDVEPY